MKRVTGIGGIFFKVSDKAGLIEWYRKHLGIPIEDYGGWAFQWRSDDDPEKQGYTLFSTFDADTDYFQPSKKDFMINLRVDDLDAVLAALREEGVQVDDRVEDGDYGKFGWIMDPDGNRIELWQPPAAAPEA